MNISEAFPSKYLSAEDIEGDTPAVISHIESEEFNDNGKKTMKPILKFRGLEKGIVLNKTNANNIAEAYGPETDEWAGQSVVLFTTWVDYQGRSVEAIRVRPGNKKPATQNRANPAYQGTQGQPQMTSAPPRGAGSSTPPQFSDPADPGYDPDDIR